MSIAEIECNFIVDTGRRIPVFASETRIPLRAIPQGSSTDTRISHELSATAPDPSASAAFRWVGRLDVQSSTPPSPSRRAPCSSGVSDASRRKPVRKAG